MIRKAQSRPSSVASVGQGITSGSTLAAAISNTSTTSNHEATGIFNMARSNHSPSNSLTKTGETSRASSSSYPHCSFCLVAEFDIDKGSTLSFQYPAPIGHDEHMLAELMLPDGVHARSEDWTVFFLPAESEESMQQQEPQQDNSRTSEDGKETSSSKGKGRSRDDLFYVLNLVRTKHDNTVRRGALVKAIAIGTRHPFIHVFKPALLLALDDYYKSPSIDVLMRLFDSLNSLDLSAMPHFSRDEKLILRASDRRDLFEERFKESPPGRAASGLRHLANLNADDDDKSKFTTTRSRSGSTSTTQSSIVEDGGGGGKVGNSSTVGTGQGRSTPHLPHRPSLASLRPGSSGSGILKRRPSAAAQLQLQQSGGLDGSHISLPNNPSSWRRPSGAAVSPMATLGNGKVKDTHYWETSVTYGKIQDLPIRIPTDVFSEEVGEVSSVKRSRDYTNAELPSGTVLFDQSNQHFWLEHACWTTTSSFALERPTYTSDHSSLQCYSDREKDRIPGSQSTSQSSCFSCSFSLCIGEWVWIWLERNSKEVLSICQSRNNGRVGEGARLYCRSDQSSI